MRRVSMATRDELLAAASAAVATTARWIRRSLCFLYARTPVPTWNSYVTGSSSCRTGRSKGGNSMAQGRGATFKDAAHDDAHAHQFWPLTLAAIGVVYGDIGTSPIYAFRE